MIVVNIAQQGFLTMFGMTELRATNDIIWVSFPYLELTFF